MSNNIDEVLLTEVNNIKDSVNLQINDTFESLKKENEFFKKELSEAKENLTKLNIAIVESNSRKKALEARYDDDSIKFLETITQPNYDSYVKTGTNLGIFTNNNPEGGILVPKMMLDELYKFIFSEGSDQISALPRTIRRMAKSIEIPVQTNKPVFTSSAECKSARCSSPKFHSNTLVGKRASACVEATWESLNYQSLYLEREIVADLRNSLSDHLAYQILNGKGTNGVNNGYLGVLNDERIQRIDADGSPLTFDLLMDLETELLIGNNPVLVMSKNNRNALPQLKGTDGQYLTPRYELLPRIIGAGRVTIGEPDSANPEDFAVEKSVNLMTDDVVIIGDFQRAYLQLLIEDLVVIRDPYTSGRKNCTNWYFHHYSDGMVVLPDGFKILENLA